MAKWMRTNTPRALVFVWIGILAGLAGGLAGGLAEVAWIYVYAALTGLDAATMALGISTAVGMGSTDTPILYGVAIHMALAAALGIALAFTLWPALKYLPGNGAIYAVTLMALAGVWALNFLIVLPRLSPGFVYLVPLQVSLMSKLLFGLAAAAVFRSIDTVRVSHKQR